MPEELDPQIFFLASLNLEKEKNITTFIPPLYPADRNSGRLKGF